MKKQFLILFGVASFSFISCKKELTDNELLAPETLSSEAKKSDGKNQKSVPFKGTYQNSHETLQGPPLFKQRVTGHGHATHLGESSFVAISNVNLTTPPPYVVSGTRVLTAANGDQLFTSFTGTSTPMGAGKSRANLLDVITGGTGRFENASGSFNAVAINDPSTSTYEVTFDGYINF